MKRFKKEVVFLAAVLVVAVLGLMQLFHDEAYAIPLCENVCHGASECNSSVLCSSSCNTSVRNCSDFCSLCPL